jgi:hypothetical protein
MLRAIAIVIAQEEEDNMNLVNTIVPIAIEDLKKYFTDKSVFYVVDYKNSKLKGFKFLTYLSNLDIPCNVDLSTLDQEETYDLLNEYLHSSMIVNIRSLEFLTMDVLKEYKGLTEKYYHSDFIANHGEILDKWVNKLDSLTIYNMQAIGQQEFKDFAHTFSESDEDELIGVNFISLLKNPEFYDFYRKIDTSKLKYYTHYFEDYMFQGKSMFSFWANENNPLFLLTYGIAEGLIDPKKYNEVKKQTLEELKNVASI